MGHAVAAQQAHAPGQGRIIGGDGAALAGRDGLDRVEREHGHVAQAAGPDRGSRAVRAGVVGADGVAGILDHGGTARPRDLGQAHEIGTLPGQMDRQYGLNREALGLGAGTGGLEGGRRQQPVVGIDIGEDGLGAGHAHGIGGGEEGNRRHNRGVAWSQIEGEAGQMQRRRARGATDRMLGTAALGQRLFEAGDHRPGSQPVAAQHGGHGIDVVIVDLLPGIGQEGFRGRRSPHQCFSVNSLASRAASSQSVLVSDA